MPKTLAEYADWLAERNLRWPVPPKKEPVQATPYIKPLAEIRAIAWDVYGTLLRIADGELLFQHPQQVRMEVALDKMLQEFGLWHPMSRKPGAPWSQLLGLYTRAYDDLRLAGSGRKGDLTEVDAAKLWRRVLSKLDLSEFKYDESMLGDLDELSEKMAYFFHSALQGLEPMDNAAETVSRIHDAGLTQGIVADGQCFTLIQVLRAFRREGTLRASSQFFHPSAFVLSSQEGARKPSKSLYLKAVERFRGLGLEPQHVLYVGARLREDLAVAKSAGFRTALFAGDKLSLKASAADVKDPTVRPDRLLTDLSQLRDVLSL